MTPLLFPAVPTPRFGVVRCGVNFPLLSLLSLEIGSGRQSENKVLQCVLLSGGQYSSVAVREIYAKAAGCSGITNP